MFQQVHAKVFLTAASQSFIKTFSKLRTAGHGDYRSSKIPQKT
jgi:hypothetical protein